MESECIYYKDGKCIAGFQENPCSADPKDYENCTVWKYHSTGDVSVLYETETLIKQTRPQAVRQNKSSKTKWAVGLVIAVIVILAFIALVSGTFSDEAHHVDIYLTDASFEHDGSVDYLDAYVDFTDEEEPINIIIDSRGLDDPEMQQEAIDAAMEKVLAKDGRPFVSLYDNLRGKTFEKINDTSFKGDEHTYSFVIRS